MLPQARQVGPDQWRARCPCHEGKSLSLSVKRGDSSALVHCFAGCDTEDVLSSISLRLADLYDAPRSRSGDAKVIRKWQRKNDLKKAIALIISESFRIWVACENLLNNIALAQQDLNRVGESARIVDRCSRTIPDTLKPLKCDVRILAAIAEIIAAGKEVFPVYSDRIIEVRHALEAAEGEV